MEVSGAAVYNAAMSRHSKIVLVLALCGIVSFLIPIAALAETGLPLPRYASLRANKVHLRTGPGIRYPVDWIFVSRGMPIEITAEFENWRKSVTGREPKAGSMDHAVGQTNRRRHRWCTATKTRPESRLRSDSTRYGEGYRQNSGMRWRLVPY